MTPCMRTAWSGDAAARASTRLAAGSESIELMYCDGCLSLATIQKRNYQITAIPVLANGLGYHDACCSRIRMAISHQAMSVTRAASSSMNFPLDISRDLHVVPVYSGYIDMANIPAIELSDLILNQAWHLEIQHSLSY